MKISRQLSTIVLLFFYNMLTKEEVVELLQSSEDIMNYEEMRASMMSWKLTGISQDSVLRCMIKALTTYWDIIKHILQRLDKTTETTS